MKKALTAGFASLLLTGVLSAPASALTVGDVDVPDTYSAMGRNSSSMAPAPVPSGLWIFMWVVSMYLNR